MMIKFKKLTLAVKLLKKRPERKYFKNGKSFSIIRPFLEIGQDEREHFKIYYFGVWRILFALFFIPDRYKPSWVLFDEALSECIVFRRTSRKKKNDKVIRPLGDKTTK